MINKSVVNVIDSLFLFSCLSFVHSIVFMSTAPKKVFNVMIVTCTKTRFHRNAIYGIEVLL